MIFESGSFQIRHIGIPLFTVGRRTAEDTRVAKSLQDWAVTGVKGPALRLSAKSHGIQGLQLFTIDLKNVYNFFLLCQLQHAGIGQGEQPACLATFQATTSGTVQHPATSLDLLALQALEQGVIKLPDQIGCNP